jgi:YD repeat-containing protein
VPLTATSAHAATAEFRYDALGRLERVTNSDGTVVIYKLDAAGNRTQVISGTSAGVPAWISVPASSTTGAYTISWGAAAGTVTAYRLYQATNSAFSGEQLVYSGTALGAALSGRPNGSYYYRVNACLDDLCSSPRAGSNPVMVALPPGAPGWVTVPSTSATGAYTISWGSASGTVTAYELYEASNASFAAEVQLYSGTALGAAVSGRANGTYFYRVRACNGASCSAHQAGPNGITVSIVVPIQVLNPSLSIGPTTTSITTLADLTGNPATIHGFTQNCAYATATIASGAQSVSWTNANFYYWQCEAPEHVQCSANYVIRNSTTGQLHPGTASVTILDQPRTLPPNVDCP